MSILFPQSPVNGQVFVTNTGASYTYNLSTNSWASGFTRSASVRQTFVGITGKTVYNIIGGYFVGYLDVYLNGVKLDSTSYTATDGFNVILLYPTNANDDLQIIGTSQFSLANAVKKTGGDTMDNVIIGGITPATASFTSINNNQVSGFRNKIINGNFYINQRTETGSISPLSGTTYLSDRWFLQASQSSKFSISPNFTNTLIDGIGINGSSSSTFSQIYIQTTTNYNVTVNDYWNFGQRIEGINWSDMAFGRATASPFTVSFLASSNTIGNFPMRFINANGSYSYVTTFNIPVANTWTYISFTVPGCTTGVWSKLPQQTGIEITFTLGNNTSTLNPNTWVNGNYNTTPGAINLVGIQNATLGIAAFQVEKGTVATYFENRPFSTELAMCQRYYEKSYNTGIPPGANVGSPNGQLYSNAPGGVCSFTYPFKVTKMAPPTVTLYDNSGTSNKITYYNSSTNSFINGATGPNISGGMNAVNFQGGLGNSTLWNFDMTASCEL